MNRISKIPRFRLAFALWVMVLQLPAVLCGFEICDMGFYMTFYDNFFSAPQSVEYNFMYWLSGLFGASIASLTDSSLLAMRIFGMMVNTASFLLVDWMMSYDYSENKSGTLQKTRKWRWPVVAGASIACIALWKSPVTFYYDTLTIFLAILSFAMIFVAMRKKESIIVFAGICAALNTFARFPNVLEIGFVLIFPICALCGQGSQRIRSRISMFFTGWLSGILIGIALMFCMGHLEIYLANLKDLFAIAATQSDEASHGLGSLIMAQINAYRLILKPTLIFLFLYFLWILLSTITRFYIKLEAAVILLLSAAYMILKFDLLTYLFGGVYALLIVNILFARPYLRMLSWAALLMLVIIPLGSDGGIYNLGGYALFMSAPVAMGAARVKPEFKIFKRTPCRAAYIPLLSLAVMASGILSLFREGVYFDSTPLREMTRSVESNRTSGVFTSATRGGQVDDMLSLIKRHVSSGDTMMVYGSAPALNWLTVTRPAFGNSWPEQFSADMLLHKLNSATPPKYVAIIKFDPIRSEWGEPSSEYVMGTSGANIYHTQLKQQIVRKFIKEKGYTLIDENQRIALFSL